MIYPHVLGARGLTNLDYVVFRPYERKLNKIKISIKTKYRPNHDYPFEVTDNVEPFGVPYIYHLFDDNILMQSLLTGTVIRKFQYNLGSTKNFKKEVFADLLISTHHPKAYLASNVSLPYFRKLTLCSNTPSSTKLVRPSMDMWLALRTSFSSCGNDELRFIKFVAYSF